MNIIVSACLLGANTRYDGKSSSTEKVISLLKQHNLIPVCPEQLGGMQTPRYPSEIQAGESVIKNSQGEDVTSYFVKGAEEALNLAFLYKCKRAILKSKSPSCGKGLVYDGSFSRRLIEGNGIFAQMLIDNGIEVYTEKDIPYFND